MSRSLKRVEAALAAAGLPVVIHTAVTETRTAAQAAAEAGCAVDQIVKSIIFAGAASGRVCLFLTPGSRQVDPDLASALAGEVLGRADADAVRAATGFAIGGVAPVGHLAPVPVWIDPLFRRFETVWAAAGTPRHIFAIPPAALIALTGAAEVPFTRAG
jgi:prolyl-tRNA editing enzyme YbaK/EbsC (Cys-tRNA(Pro) deacylase)